MTGTTVIRQQNTKSKNAKNYSTKHNLSTFFRVMLVSLSDKL